MRRRMSVLLAVLLLPAAASAQQFPTPKLHGGINVLYGSPRGEFANYIDQSWGLGANFRWTPLPALGLRLDGGFMNYGRETQVVPLSGTIGGRVMVDLTTDNNIVYVGVGPQLQLPSGPIRPYLAATAGLAYFATTSSVKGDNNSEAFASDTNFDDALFQWGGTGGVYIPVKAGLNPIAIDFAARYHGNGEATYLKEGSIIDNADGTISFDPIRSEANVVTFHLGVSVGIGAARR